MTDSRFNGQGTSRWIPGDEVRSHFGFRIDSDSDFFSPPNQTIGNVQTASSTAKKSERPVTGRRLSFLVLGPGFLVMLGVAIGTQWSSPTAPYEWTRGCVPGALLGLLVSNVMFLSFVGKVARTCSYVGEKGLSKSDLRGLFRKQPVESRLLFDTCHSLKVSHKSVYIDRVVYVGTDYSYVWSDKSGRELFHIRGTYRSEKRSPDSADPFWFADAAERQWSEYARELMLKKFEAQGYVDFRAKDTDRFRIGPGFLEVIFHGEMSRLIPEDVKALTVVDGRLVVHTHEARWFSNRGKFEFLYDKIENAKLLLRSLEELGGFSLQ